MSIALIKTNPLSIIEVFPGDYADVNVAVGGARQMRKVGVGYATPDGLYRMVPVMPFIPPDGRMTVGDPSYAINADGVVTKTFATEPIT